MKETDNLESDLEQAIRDLQVEVAPVVDQRILADATAELPKPQPAARPVPEASYDSAERAQRGDLQDLSRRRTRRSIIRRILPVGAGVAAAICVGIVVLYILLGTSAGTGVAFAQITEALQKASWIHTVNTVTADGATSPTVTEEWLDLGAKREIAKDSAGKVVCRDFVRHEQHEYDPASGKVAVTHQQGNGLFDASGPLEMIQQLIDMEKQRGASVEQTTGQYEGRTIPVLKMTRPTGTSIEHVRVMIDPATKLPMAAEVAMIDAQGSTTYAGHVRFDYPQAGPKDIYDLGVPRSAGRVSHLPSGPFSEVLDAYDKARDSSFQRYIAIVTSADQTHGGVIDNVRLIYCDGPRVKVEMRTADGMAQDWPDIASQMGNTFESLLTWWTTNPRSYFWDIHICDGRQTSEVYHERGKDSSLRIRMRECGVHNHNQLAYLAWPNITRPLTKWIKVDVAPDEYSQANGLIRIEQTMTDAADSTHVSRQVYYLNPQKDYICQRQEWTDSKDRRDQTWEVKEYMQLPDGRWLPKVREVRWVPRPGTPTVWETTIETIFLNTDPQFATDTFDPAVYPATSAP